MTKTLNRISLGCLIACFTVFAFHVSAQSPPTATEAFNLRIKCKEMSDRKAQEVMETNIMVKWEFVAAWNTSRYDPDNNRCYGRIYEHIIKQDYHLDHESDQLFDLQIDDLLAGAMSKTEKSTDQFGTTITRNLGFHRVVQTVARQILAIRRGKLPKIT